MGLFDLFRGKKKSGKKRSKPMMLDESGTRRGMLKHSQEQFQALTDRDVIHVLMLHEASSTSDGYEEHLLSHLLPKLARSGFRRIDSLHGVDPRDPGAAQQILEKHGYDNFAAYAVAHEFADAGEGTTGVLAVMRAVVMGKPVISMPGD